MILKVLDHRGIGYSSSLAEGIYYAVNNGAKVINLSLAWTVGLDPGPIVYEAVRYAADSGVIMVAGTGNDSRDLICYPAAYDEVIAVGATQLNYERATALTTGVVSLMLSLEPDLDVTEIRDILFETATDLGQPGLDNKYGYGLINAGEAMAHIAGGTVNKRGKRRRKNKYRIGDDKNDNGDDYFRDNIINNYEINITDRPSNGAKVGLDWHTWDWKNEDGVIVKDEDDDGYPQVIDEDGIEIYEDDIDCNDNDPTMYPGAAEIANDGIDQDCDGSDLIVSTDPEPGEPFVHPDCIDDEEIDEERDIYFNDEEIEEECI